AVVAAGLFLFGGGADPGRAARALLDEANASYGAARHAGAEAGRHLRAARSSLRRLLAEHPDAPAARSARILAADTDRALKELAALAGYRDLLEKAGEVRQLEDARGRLVQLAREADTLVVPHVEALEREFLRKARELRHRIWAEAAAAVQELVARERFGAALRHWKTFRARRPEFGGRADGAIADLEAVVTERYRKLIEAARQTQNPEARIEFLEAARPTCRGTDYAEDLEVRVAGIRARRYRPLVPLVRKTEPSGRDGATGREPTEPAPEQAGPYVDPAEVAEFVGARRFAEAARLLPQRSRHPLAGVRQAELELMAGLIRSLAEAVSSRAGEFTSVLLPGGVRGDAVGADERFLRLRAGGEEIRAKWGSLPPRSFVKLFRVAGLLKPPRLAVALFYDETGLRKRAKQAYVAWFRGARDKELFNLILARRRVIDPPEGGFVLHQGEILTPAERDTLVLQARIEELGRDAVSGDARRRLGAWEELEGIGEPARETLRASIRQRRHRVGEELRAARAFSRGRAAVVLGADLKKAREHALKMIL
ncbi:MAG: hypothetical protein ACE5JG_12900, partial [Planctomycetota bacterium]